jgi:hypothetical protein
MARESQPVINAKIFSKLDNIVEKLDALQETSSRNLSELSNSTKDILTRVESLSNQYMQFKITQEYKNKEFAHDMSESQDRIVALAKETSEIALLVSNIKFFLKNWKLVTGGMILTVVSAIATMILSFFNKI